MTLTAQDLRYIEIVRLAAEGKTYAQIGELVPMASSPAAISRALRWGERIGLNNYEAAKKLKFTIARLRKHQEWLERKLRQHEAVVSERLRKRRQGIAFKGEPALAVATVQVFSRELVDVEMKIAELDGIYNHALNLNVGGMDGNALKVEVEVVRAGDKPHPDQ